MPPRTRKSAEVAESTEPVDPTPETAAEETPEPVNGAAPVDFLALLATAEVDDKAPTKSTDRKAIEVPEAWIVKVKDTFESRKRVRIPGITTKVLFSDVGDLIRAAADRLDLSATVRAVYSPAPEGTEEKDRELCALSFTVGPRRKGPKAKSAPVPSSGDSVDTDVPNADGPVSATGESGE